MLLFAEPPPPPPRDKWRRLTHPPGWNSNSGLRHVQPGTETLSPAVQMHMRRDAAQLAQLLGKQQGHLYVCGDAKKMAKDVHACLLALHVQQLVSMWPLLGQAGLLES